MKILNISHMFITPYDKMDICVLKIVLELESIGHNVTVLCPQPWSPFPISLVNRRWKQFAKVPLHMNWYGIDTYYPRYLAIPRSILITTAGHRMLKGIRRKFDHLNNIKKFDIIHAHMGYPDGYAAMMLKKQYKIPYVVTLQGTDLDITIQRSEKCRKLLTEIIENANRVIVPTPNLVNKYEKVFMKKVDVVGYGFEPNEIFFGKSSIREKYENKVIILSVSRLIQTKGIDLMLIAISKLLDLYKDIVYVVIGDGPERKRLEKIADRLRLGSRVQFLGEKNHEEVMEYMSICDIFALPSWQETFGLVYIEAMANGKPVIAVLGQGMDGIVKNGETGLLTTPRDTDDLVRALSYLLENSNVRKEIGERAKMLVYKNFTWKKIAETHEEVYEKALRSEGKEK